jgi:hypothetical protein
MSSCGGSGSTAGTDPEPRKHWLRSASLSLRGQSTISSGAGCLQSPRKTMARRLWRLRPVQRLSRGQLGHAHHPGHRSPAPRRPLGAGKGPWRGHEQAPVVRPIRVLGSYLDLGVRHVKLAGKPLLVVAGRASGIAPSARQPESVLQFPASSPKRVGSSGPTPVPALESERLGEPTMAVSCPMCGNARDSNPLRQPMCACPTWLTELFRRVLNVVAASSMNDLTLLTVNHFPTWTIGAGRCACGLKWPCRWVKALASRFDLEAPPDA